LHRQDNLAPGFKLLCIHPLLVARSTEIADAGRCFFGERNLASLRFVPVGYLASFRPGPLRGTRLSYGLWGRAAFVLGVHLPDLTGQGRHREIVFLGEFALRYFGFAMPAITVQKTVTAIVERSDPVVVPLVGVLALVPGDDGRYRLQEKIVEGFGDVGRLGVWARDAKGRRLPAGRVLSRVEAERVVRILMGLDEKPARPGVGGVRAHAAVV
jgi:hypothetical protein